MRSEPGRALFVRTGALGDFCLTLPTLAALVDAGHTVDLICTPRFAALAAQLLGADRLGTVTDAAGLGALWIFGGRAPARYACAVAWTAAHADGLRAAGVDDVRCVAPRPPDGVPAVVHLNGAWPCNPARTFPLAVAREPARIMIAPGSAGADKRWPMARWQAVAAMLEAAGREVRWVGGPLEPWATDRPALPELAVLAAGCGAWLGADSGPAQLAARVGARVHVVGPAASAAWTPPGARFHPMAVDPEALAAAVLAG